MIPQNIEKSPGNLRLAVIQTSVKKIHLKQVWKTYKEKKSEKK